MATPLLHGRAVSLHAPLTLARSSASARPCPHAHSAGGGERARCAAPRSFRAHESRSVLFTACPEQVLLSEGARSEEACGLCEQGSDTRELAGHSPLSSHADSK
eukprot:1768120-Pleurochrysis_carterae.AAC.2